MLKRHPLRMLSLIVLSFLALELAYDFATPAFEYPDEDYHFAYIRYLAAGHGLPVQGESPQRHAAEQEGSQPPLYYTLAAALTFWPPVNPHAVIGYPVLPPENVNRFRKSMAS